MISHRSEWIGMLTGVCVVLGGLLALTVRTQQNLRTGIPTITNSSELAQEWDQMQTKILHLQNELAEAHHPPDSSKQTEELLMLAGMTHVKGPGIVVTLTDNPHISGPKLDPSLQDAELLNAGIIHDVDLLRVCNELFAAHAEAIAVNGQRIGPRTAIRCVGPVVNVNQVGMASPFRIEVIGDPTSLQAALNLPGGVLQQLRGMSCGATVEASKSLTLPPFDGAVEFPHAQLVGAAPKDQAQP